MATLSTFLSGLVGKKNTAFQLIDAKTKQSINMQSLAIQDVSIFYNATLTQNRNEAGVLLTDSKVINPVRVEVRVIGNATGFKSLQALFAENTQRKTLYTVKARGLTLEHLVLTQIAQERTPDILNATQLRLSFNSIVFKESDSPSFAKDGDQSSVFNTIKNEVEKTGKQVEDLVKEIV